MIMVAAGMLGLVSIIFGILGFVGLVKTLVKNPPEGALYGLAILSFLMGVSGDELIVLVWGLAGIPAFLAYFYLRLKTLDHNKYNRKKMAIFRNWVNAYYCGPVGLAIGLMIDKYNLTD